RRLHLYLDSGWPRPPKWLDEPLPSVDHPVALDWEFGRPADRLPPLRPEGQVRQEVAVHPLDLDPVGARGLGLLDLFREPPDVGREDRGDYLDACLPHLWGSTRRSRGMGRRCPSGAAPPALRATSP